MNLAIPTFPLRPGWDKGALASETALVRAGTGLSAPWASALSPSFLISPWLSAQQLSISGSH